jgi:hypothetical protein
VGYLKDYDFPRSDAAARCLMPISFWSICYLQLWENVVNSDWQKVFHAEIFGDGAGGPG